MIYQYIKDSNKDSRSQRRCQDKEKWKALEEGWLKMNCGGAFDPIDKMAGVGVVIRNCEGRIMDGKIADSMLQVHFRLRL